jgi:glucose/mannose-6-phosphate isomerase
MNLNDSSAFRKLDPSNMLAQIDGLPDQLAKAWELGNMLALASWGDIERVLIAGMGGSAIGADLLGAYVSPLCHVPVVVHRDYDLPAWASGQKTLVITSSHSGNTEETLSAFKQAIINNCRILAISTGGKLAEVAEKEQTALWRFEHQGQPRAAVGFSFGLLLAAFSRLSLIPNPSEALNGAIMAMKAQQAELNADIPDVRNPAKRLAGQLVNRWVSVIGSDQLAPVARRWKGQISEVAKAWAQFEFLPEADHNTLAGILNPEEQLTEMMVLFLRAPSQHPRNALRSDLTRRIFMLQGIGTDSVDASGDNPLAHLWTALHYGDYVAYYLAMIYGVDPTPVEAIEGFKKELKAAG